MCERGTRKNISLFLLLLSPSLKTFPPRKSRFSLDSPTKRNGALRTTLNEAVEEDLGRKEEEEEDGQIKIPIS